MEYEVNTNICFDCQNACGGCSWSRKFEPVPGWTAVPNRLMVDNRPIDTYHITACPEFKPDEPRTVNSQELTLMQYLRGR